MYLALKSCVRFLAVERALRLYARYLCSRAHSAARPSARATIGYLVYKLRATGCRACVIWLLVVRLLRHARCHAHHMVGYRAGLSRACCKAA